MSVKDSELVQDFSLEDLFKAYYDCRKHKRNTLSAIEFEVHLERNLLKLYHELKDGTYRVGRYICFIVLLPKPREVWAANFRDRIVHHLIYNAIKDRFHKRFISDTYSCIPKRGTLACARKMLHFSRSVSLNYKKRAYFLKADLSNFFVSIDKQILFELLKENVKEPWILELLEKVIFHDPKRNVFVKSKKKLFERLPAHKSLWRNSSALRGLPIGNLTSQFFSNVYLNMLDQYVKCVLGCKFYCRYVDDFFLLDSSPITLQRWCNLIRIFVSENLKIELNPRKCFINSITKGIDIVGFFIKPHRLILRRRTVIKIFRIIYSWLNSYNRFSENLKIFFMEINSYLGMLKNTVSFDLRFEICSLFNCLFIGVNRRFSKSIINYC